MTPLVLAASLAMRSTALVGTAAARAAIEAASGIITHANELASWAIALTVEIDAGHLRKLHSELESRGAIWISGAEGLLAQGVGASGSPSRDAIVLLHLEFLDEDPSRRLKIPSVPG